MRFPLSLLAFALIVTAARGENLLRNGDFQDDWCTQLPELKNHHWNYSTEVYNRRDYNPDGWSLSGKWEWRDADRPRGQRKLILSSPSRVVQSVNWVTINNSAKLSGWPDAGGFPAAEAARSKNPLALVRDLEFRVKIKAAGIPKDAAKIVVAWSDASPLDDPLGLKRSASATAAVPEGTYDAKEVSVKLPAATWLEAAEKDPLFAAQGALIPMAATVEIIYADKQAGTVELIEASLTEPGPRGPNLLPNGDFENTGPMPGWSRKEKYRYFPPGLYYIFNTWHNSNSRLSWGITTISRVTGWRGTYSLQIDCPPGEEACVASDPVILNQKEARLIEVRAMVRTDRLAMLQIDAEDENGKRIDCFNLIHKSMPSVGTNDWRIVRQVFRPSVPLKSIRVKLAARGTNGYTLDDTSQQPQQNAAGTIWWDDVQLFEPEATAEELKARGAKEQKPVAVKPGFHVAKVNRGEQLFGQNYFTAEVVNPGPGGSFRYELQIRPVGGQRTTFEGGEITIPAGKTAPIVIPYELREPPSAYTRHEFELVLRDEKDQPFAAERILYATWTAPIDLQLGALYLRPNQKQFVRANLGLTYAEMQKVKGLRLEVLRRGSGEVLKTFTVPATLADIQKQRAKIPDGLRGDFRNLFLTDLDLSFLPLQPFADPQRNWVIRATVIDTAGKASWSVTSQPFCRLAHDGPQPAIASVKINEHGDFLVNDKPWMPWGVTYGHNPVYDGPADGGKYHDLANLKPWGMYDRHGGTLSDRSQWDLNCLRHVEGPLVKPMQLEEMWKKGLYASTVFIPPPTAKNPWPDDLLKYLRTAPNVAAVSRGPEEAFGYFYPMTAQQLDAVKGEVDYLRKTTGKPVMVGHGGYWTRLELEKVPFFDVYDPETEPWYPAPVHTDLAPLVAGKPKTIWLRPQMYESVPYERWRYHVYAELMRGARGWQIAHGPGDASLMRGLHAELRYLQPFVYSRAKPPEVKIEPGMEFITRQLGNKTLIVAATTHGMSFGNWQWSEAKSPHGRTRVTADPHIFRDESDGYHATGDPAAQNLVPHGIQYLIDPKKWPAGSKLVTWAKIDPKNPPKSLVAVVKGEGRWTHAAGWGAADFTKVRTDNAASFWFLRTFYRHARGFLGWGDKVPAQALELIPDKPAAMGELPKAGEWVKLEVPLDTIGAANKLIDGVGFLHDGGRVWWAGTVLVTPDGKETVVFGDHEDRPDPATLEKTKVIVAGLKKGTKVRVLFEDREIVAADGFFVDDFRGVDLYQRYGSERSGYGNAPVALHVYELVSP
jgi:hypothetical protein